jgi:hypothetical protein
MVARKARAVITAERRTKAVQMKIEGATWDAIAKELGYAHKAAACTDVQRALEQNVIQQGLAIEAWRELELGRLDAMQLAIWPKAMEGDCRAIETCLKILDQRAKYLGLNTAIKLEVLTVDALDAQIAKLESELARAGLPAGDGEAGEAEEAP